MNDTNGMTGRELNDLLTQLAETCEEDTKFLSIMNTGSHPSVVQIVNMGNVAIPFLLRRLKTDPIAWMCALQQITGYSPVPPSHYGKIKAMIGDWMQWGIDNGYISWVDVVFDTSLVTDRLAHDLMVLDDD